VQDAWSNKQGLVPRWETYEVMESVSHPELIGRRLAELAAEMDTDPFDVLLDLALTEPTLRDIRVKAVVANDDPEGVALLLVEEHMTLGLSDAGAHVSQLCDAPQATDLLGNWVRQRGVLTIEQAVRKLSGQQADIFGFADRGYLTPGAWADVVVFDPLTVGPGPLRRVRDFPANGERLTADQPTGIRHVFVNGDAIQLDGVTQLDAHRRLPGQMLRPSVR
jgi:N-acyl-D-amino-acid deacylase